FALESRSSSDPIDSMHRSFLLRSWLLSLTPPSDLRLPRSTIDSLPLPRPLRSRHSEQAQPRSGSEALPAAPRWSPSNSHHPRKPIHLPGPPRCRVPATSVAARENDL